MTEERMIDKTTVSRAVISKIQGDNNPDKIESKHISDYETPKKMIFEGKKNGFIPDIVTFFNTEPNIYEIELEKEISFEKWKLFDTYAKKNNGKFFIVAPDYLKEGIKKLIKDEKINAGLIYFTTK